MKPGDSVQIKGWPGVAFYVRSIDEDGDSARVVMVGDDRVHDVDLDECTELQDEEFCAVCGQLGCTHDGRN